jgi:hypothetical protein
LTGRGEIKIVVRVHVENMDAGKFGIVHTGLFHGTGYLTLFAACTIYGVHFYFFAVHGSLTPST